MIRLLKIAVTAAALSLASALPSSAESVDVSTITCKDLMDTAEAASNSDKKLFAKTSSADASKDKAAEQMGVLMFWLYGFNAPQDNGPVIDFAALEGYVEKLGDFCKSNPKIGLVTASEKFSGKNAPKPSKDAVDVSTLKCSVVKSEMDNQTAASILWLAGWYAANDNDTSFDFDDLGSKMKSFGEYCAKNPNKGFNSAARAVFQE